jgi:hypothetical protein
VQILPEVIMEGGSGCVEDANDVFMRYEPYNYAYYDQPKILMSRKAI